MRKILRFHHTLCVLSLLSMCGYIQAQRQENNQSPPDLINARRRDSVQRPTAWKSYRYPADGFSAEFPATPRALPPQVADNGFTVNVYQIVNASKSYSITVAGKAGVFLVETISEQMSQNVIENVSLRAKADLIDATEIKLGEISGREYRFSNDKTVFLCRVFLAADKLYQLVFSAARESPDTNSAFLKARAESDKFFSGFHITDEVLSLIAERRRLERANPLAELDLTGAFENSVYRNPGLGFNLSLPEGWKEKRRGAAGARLNEEIDAIAEFNPAVSEQAKRGINNSRFIFQALKVGADDEASALSLYVEYVTLPNIDLSDYVESSKQLFKQLNTRGTFYLEATQKLKLNGVEIYYYDVETNNDGFAAFVRNYVFKRKNLFVGIVTAYRNNSQLLEIEQIVSSLRFE